MACAQDSSSAETAVAAAAAEQREGVVGERRSSERVCRCGGTHRLSVTHTCENMSLHVSVGVAVLISLDTMV